MSSRDGALGRIRLRHLQCFLAVARGGNLRRAAEELAITQPAVTKTLNELEAILGVRLFERGRRGAVATPQATVFLRHAQASVNALGQAVDSVLRGHDEVALRLGVLPTVAPSLVPRVLQNFRAERPHARVTVTTGRNAELLAQLRQRELDLVVGRMADPDDMVGLTFELLYAEPLAIVARKGHRLLSPRALSAAAIAAQPWVLPAAGTMIRHAADSWCTSHGIAPRNGVTETLSLSLARALVLTGDALWFTPRSAAEPDVESGALAELPLSTAGTEEPVGLLLRTDSLPSAAVQGLLTALRAHAAARRAASAKAIRAQLRRRLATTDIASKPAPSRA
jgi:LysR family pca operon transcriptional activator